MNSIGSAHVAEMCFPVSLLRVSATDRILFIIGSDLDLVAARGQLVQRGGPGQSGRCSGQKKGSAARDGSKTERERWN